MRFQRKAFAVLALSLATALGACDSVERMTDVTEATEAPAYSYNKKGGKKWSAWLKRLSADGGEVGFEEIGSNGGTVQVGGHKLIVSKGTVSDRTWFIMHVRPGENIHVELHAFRKSNGREVNEFEKPIKLVLSLTDADISDLDKARVAYLIDGDINGDIDIVSGAAVDKRNKTITALLHHFSGYAVCID